MTNMCWNFTKTRVGPTKNQVITKKPSGPPKGTCEGTLKVNFSKCIYLFKRQSLKFLFLHVSCLIFSEKKRYPWSMCRRKHGEKAQTLVTLPQNTTKKSTYKRELALQREVWACPNQLKFHPMRFLQQDVQRYFTCSHRHKGVMLNINKI